jgi:hypothetical protein
VPSSGLYETGVEHVVAGTGEASGHPTPTSAEKAGATAPPRPFDAGHRVGTLSSNHGCALGLIEVLGVLARTAPVG